MSNKNNLIPTTMKNSINIPALVKFAYRNDFAFCTNGGIVYANDRESRQWVAKYIEQAESVDIVSPEECADLDEEAANGCTIYHAYSYNDPNGLYIAVYGNIPVITTLNQLADYINTLDTYENDIIEFACEANGWNIHYDEWDIADDGKELVTFSESGEAIVVAL